MAKNTMNIRIYGDLASGVYVAPKGTTLPTDLVTALNASFKEIGWLAEDGVGEAQTGDTATFIAWQGSTVVKRKRTQAQKKFTFECLEENAETMGLKYRGKTPTITGTDGAKVAKYDFADQNVTDERAWVIETKDGSVVKRHVVPAGAYEISGTQPHAATGITTLTVEITVIGDGAYELTNHPGVTGDTTITSY